MTVYRLMKRFLKGSLGLKTSTIIISIIGVAPSPFDVDAIVEVSRQGMIEQGQDQNVIEQAEEFTRKFFWVFPFIAIVANVLFGAIVGGIGANVFKKGSEEGRLL